MQGAFFNIRYFHVWKNEIEQLTAMHENHACMLYLNPFVSAINDHQLGEIIIIIGSSEAIALEDVEVQVDTVHRRSVTVTGRF